MGILFFVVALALCAVVFSLFLKDSKMPVLALLVPLTAGLLILLKLIPSLVSVFREIDGIAKNAGLTMDYMPLLLKVVAVAYLGEFAGELCRDAGENGLAKKVEFAVKIIIMLLALPLLKAILNAVLTLLK